jgi:S1-C subfamily serine protease
VTETVVDGATTVVLGDASDGERIELRVAEHTSLAAPPSGNGTPGAPPPPAGAAIAAPVVAAPADRPGGNLREEPVPPTVVTGNSLAVQVGGRSYTFQPGKEVVIGRDPSCDVQVDNPVVSRRHASLRSTGNGWELADYGSSSGTFIDGDKVTTAPLRGSTAVFLGPEDVGERMVVVTSGPSRPSRRRRGGSRVGTGAIVAGVLIAGLAVVIAVIALLARGGDSGPDLAKLREATVAIETDSGSGSGSIISEDGLILTNAHVAAPDALGQGVLYTQPATDLDATPQEVTISVLRDGAAEPAYFAEVRAVDGYLDLAVLQITRTIGGNIIGEDDDLDLTVIDLGDSEALEQGDELWTVGYPGIAETSDATVAEGRVGSFERDNRLSDNRAFINTDANISGGNSGGLASDHRGRLIGTPTQVSDEERTSTEIGKVRPIHLAMPLIDAVRNGTKYETAFVRPADGATAQLQSVVTPASSPGFQMNCAEAAASSARVGQQVLAVEFSYEGFPTSGHQDAMVIVLDPSGEAVGLVTAVPQYPLAWNGSGCATVTVPLETRLQAGSYRIGLFAGGNYELVDDGVLTVPPAS